MTERQGRPRAWARTGGGRHRGLVLGAALALGAGALTVCQLPGPTFVVTTTADGVDADPGDSVCETALGNDICTLRAAVMEANADAGTNNIELGDGATYVLTLAGGGEDGARTGDLDIAGTVAINGRSTIDAHGIDRVLDVRSGSLILDGPTITGGGVHEEPFVGGGILVGSGASLAVGNATIDGNAALDGGGGIYSTGAVTLVSVTVSDNMTSGAEPGEGSWFPAPGAGVSMHSAPLTVVSSSIVANVITDYGNGGGLFADGTGTITVDRSTISGNRASYGSGAAIAGGEVTVRSSTIVDNAGGAALSASTLDLTASTVASTTDRAVEATSATARGSIFATLGPACWGPIASQGYNLATDATCGLSGTGDQQSVDPLLGPLADNGGPTRTLLPFANSPAVDSVPLGTAGLCDGSVPTDQRGLPRPTGAGCDIGAVEGGSPTSADPLELVVDDAGDGSDLVPGDGACVTASGHCSLRAAIDETNTWPAPDAVTIAAGINPAPLPDPVFPSVTDDLVLHGGGATITAPDGTGSMVYGPLSVAAGTVAIDHTELISEVGMLVLGGDVTVSDSLVTGSRNSGISARGPSNLHLVRSTVAGNRVGVEVSQTTASITQSTIAGNRTEALVSYQVPGAPPVPVVASTLSGPADGSANAIRADSANPVHLRGSIVSTGAGMPACAPGAAVSDGYNVVGDTSCGAATGDRTGADPLLLPLGENGGPTPTRRPFANSPAVDAIPTGTAGLCGGAFPTDQRGSARPVGAACDAGAVEGPSSTSVTAPLSLTVTSAADAADASPGNGVCATAAGACTLRAAIDESNAWPRSDTIAIAAGINPTLTIPGMLEDANATGDLDVLDHVTILGNGRTLDAGHVDAAIDRHVGTTTITQLTIRGAGFDGTSRSGAVTSQESPGRLVVTGSVITANDTNGIWARSGLTVRATSITDNVFNGIVADGLQPGVVDQSTISGNAGGVSSYAPLAIRRSTIVGNTGAAIYATTYFAGITVTASTIVAANPYGAIITPSGGGGSVTVAATALANTGGPACSERVPSGGSNRVTDTTCQFAGPGDLTVASLGLEPLADNGGLTRTRLPKVGSTLLDAIPVGTSGLCDAALPTDQRTQPRPQGPACDIGSVERTP